MSVEQCLITRGAQDDIRARTSSLGQAVFQVPLYSNQEKLYHARRPHKKSRGGCITSQCDEGKPTCIKCQKYGAPCSYSTRSSGKGSITDVASSTQKPDDITFSFSLSDLATRIEQVLNLDTGTNTSLVERNAVYPVSMVAFQHFIKCSTETVANPGLRAVMRSDMIRVSFTSPYLMYTIIAVGVLHLNRVSPGNKTRQFAETYFWQRAIKLYQAALTSNVTPQNVDSLLSTCMFMGLTSLCPENIKPTDSWVLSDKSDAMNWLCLQSGLRCIITLAKPYLDSSIWASTFQHAHEDEVQFLEHVVKQGREGLDPDLADLCGIDESTTAKTNPYYEPLASLTALFQLEKNFKNSAKCAEFMGKLSNDFLALLRRRDPPALLILAQWMGLMCTLSQWQPWIFGRLVTECIAICMYLEHDPDPRISRLLEFPATACGYSSRDVSYSI
ncbi:C6 transcription factor [Aspergillus nomiae NRRL 13137]|uniref:C6 transcription factor n=1 Tax=Aspergillus nomiae NRRL (strain ATCC 15546 / NRRL 13137 / CBS 260.88 / M93) TaxID=1509407 RepID=A0A0L1JGI6_ASPN3|nr:C6 transcription factor [Aspergillus nomiae NRRL 13137]KNG90879.1 C6 transcription factor [Aspergillus nomiae NRRL 13137]